MVHFKIIQGQTERQRCWRSNLKRPGFDPITEIIRNLFRFHMRGRATSMPKNFCKILQALNYQGDNFLPVTRLAEKNGLELKPFRAPYQAMRYSLRPATYEDRAVIERFRRGPWLLSLGWVSVTSDDCTL
jgi:hypothetical protein